MSQDVKQADRRALLQNALTTIEKLQTRLNAIEKAQKEPIAIIGMSCRFPGGANSPEAYWDLLQNGVDAVTPVPADRWHVPDYDDTTDTWYGGFLQNLDQFDPQFFGLSPREASSMDPQQRLVLETSWEALERAGYAPDKLKGSQTAIFVGITTNDYVQLALAGDLNQLDAYTATGGALNVAPGRVAYTLGLQGPSMAIDTACSSSLVAVHQACQSLRTGESELALAGGVNVLLRPEAFVCFNQWGMMSPDGRCKTFDADANGFVRGEGCGMMVLKRLSAAQADGDNILAVIRGSAVNQDGRSSGLTVPNGRSQEAVVRTALTNAGVKPSEIGYVEAHGTGTSLGDPIEVEALGTALSAGRTEAHPLFLSSVKTNLGHLESASGIAGLFKVVLALQHQQIPPHLHLQERSPRVPWPNFPVIIPTQTTPWNPANGSRLAGVSSFGFSGTNAHIILQEAPTIEPVTLSPDRPWHLLTLSAKTASALQTQARNVAHHLQNHPEHALADVAYTANIGRARLEHRLAMVADSAGAMQQQLVHFSADDAAGGRPGKLAFLFAGQGSQYVNMGKQLYHTQPAFRQTLNQCDEILRPYLNRSLLEILYPADIATAAATLLDQTGYTQPALFALEYSLAKLWQSWGIKPDAVMGHSVGEYVAACVAGVFCLEDGLKLIAERGRLMQALPAGGAMAAVFADKSRVVEMIRLYAEHVSLAAINGPDSVVISGDGSDVAAIIEKLAAAGIKSRRLTVSHAFHSPLMAPMLAEFLQIARGVSYGLPHIDLVSNVTGQIAGPEIAGPGYWHRHISAPVLFADAINTLHRQGYQTFLEIGPKPTLLGMGQRCVDNTNNTTWLPSLRPGRPDWQPLLQSLGRLFVHGFNINWAGFEKDYAQGRRRVELPTYPFERSRYWQQVDYRPNTGSTSVVKKLHPLLGHRLRSPLIQETVFQTVLAADTPAFLADHQLYGTVVFPGTGYLEMAHLAAEHAFGAGPHLIESVALEEVLTLPQNQEQTVQVILSPAEKGVATFQVCSLADEAGDSWKTHARGDIRLSTGRIAAPDVVSLDEIKTRCAEPLVADDYYQKLNTIGIEYGPGFRGLTQIWRRDGEALGHVALPLPFSHEATRYGLHPGLLDACFQLLGTTLPVSNEPVVYVPVGLAHLERFQTGLPAVWSHAVINLNDQSAPAENLIGNLNLFDAQGQPVAKLTGLQLRRITQDAIRRATQPDFNQWLYQLQWQRQALPQDISALPTGTWLIFADASGTGATLAAEMQSQGHACILVQPGPTYQSARNGVWRINPTDATSFKQLLTDAAQVVGGAVQGVVHCWSLDISTSHPASMQPLGYGSVLHLVQALVTTDATQSLRLALVTRGAQAVNGTLAAEAMAQAPVWGMSKSIVLEHSELQLACIDLDPSGKTDEVEMLAQEVLQPGPENQIALRQGIRYVARLESYTQSAATPGIQGPFELGIKTPGIIDSLTFNAITRTAPGPDEVEIEVRATGLNFRDVLNALGMYPGPKIPFGNECAGVVAAVGEGISGINPGDEVIGLATGTFKSHVVAPADYVFPKPANLSFAQAITVPTTFLTAYYGLYHLANIKQGDRVLIHSAAGGVGLAAVQLAQRAGAEIFGTAGSPEKRAYLKSIGVQHVFSSRTLDFAEQIKEVTNGAGVDIILNSLADEFIAKSLSILAGNGCFLELGKRDQWDQAQVAKLNPTFTYHRYDLALEMQNNLQRIRSMFHQLLNDFGTNTLKPLPLQAFAMADAAEAFRFMAQAKHIGKIVVTQRGASQPMDGIAINAEATYLITGGLGGLGLTIARWLVERGARYLVLLGRSKPAPSAQQALALLEQAGAHILIAQADVSQHDDVLKVLNEVSQSMPPLRGIIHAAGVLDDGALTRQTIARFERVLAPKVAGAWHLHQLTIQLPLDFFILFSAGASLLGSAGQSNYAAANAGLDALAHYRHTQGLPALSINWGAWANVGMAAKLDKQAQQRWAGQGISRILPEEGTQILWQLGAIDVAQVAVLPINWGVFGGQINAIHQPFFSNLLTALPQPAAPKPATSTINFVEQLRLLSADDQHQQLLAHVQAHVVKILGLDPSQPISSKQGFTELGMDSLMAVQISNGLKMSLNCKLPATVVFEHPTLDALTRYLKTDVLELEAAGASSGKPAGATKADEVMADMENLSDAELEDAIFEELRHAGYQPESKE